MYRREQGEGHGAWDQGRTRLMSAWHADGQPATPVGPVGQLAPPSRKPAGSLLFVSEYWMIESNASLHGFSGRVVLIATTPAPPTLLRLLPTRPCAVSMK